MSFAAGDPAGTDGAGAVAPTVSVLVPCYNEEHAVEETVRQLDDAMAVVGHYEIVAIEDGSTDDTLAKLHALAARFPRLRVVAHDRNRGYGAALKTGMRNALAPLIAITDADGTYPIADLPRLVAMAANFDMVVGARTGSDVTYSTLRKIPKFFLRKWINWIVNMKVPDINSGMRVFRKDMAQKFVRILPNGFSFTITITISALRNNYRVHFEPINYFQRKGKSKIHPIKDTLRFAQIIGRTGMYFAPLRILAPVIVLLLAGSAASLAYDTFVLRDLTEKSLVLLTMSLNVGIFAILADMIDKRSGI
ncbi:glycosyltransferase family 2 protein [Luteimonas sp. M1R5S18]|uniref:Glycosyltransferase family 2 protein n=1 Tax=Luteimonas rhizosphaericola TaxID=3042024 RepID=A0ABT6JMC6_9GAMM|nr:glycosyltransferase family 2 protein [Luteimonas rhizosphaericola]MDH5831834.1 glycosyltransferase family 2 protein [Luteimonas rhizosphaericola]